MAHSQAMALMTSNASAEWYTPAWVIDLARAVLGAIDLDPASNDTAQQRIQAARYYTAETLVQPPWSGEIWLNPLNYGKICTCHTIYDVATVKSGNQPQPTILDHDQSAHAGLRHNAASVNANASESVISSGNPNENPLKADETATDWQIRAWHSVPAVNALSPLQTITFLNALLHEPALPHGAVNVLVNMLGISKRADAPILFSALKCLSQKNDTGDLRVAVSGSASSLSLTISSADNATGHWPSIGRWMTGQLAKTLGITDAPIVEVGQNSLKIILSLSPTLHVPAQFHGILSQPATHAIAPKTTDRPTNGVQTLPLFSESAHTSTDFPCANQCIPVRHPITVWLNPPFNDTPGWCKRLEHAYLHGDVTAALLLVNSAPGYEWFESLWRRWPVCMIRRRMRFERPDGSAPGNAKKGQAVFYFGTNVDLFHQVFSPHGRILLPDSPAKKVNA